MLEIPELWIPAEESGKSSRERSVLWSTKLNGIGCFDIRHGDAVFGVFPASFRSCFGPAFPQYVPFLGF